MGARPPWENLVLAGTPPLPHVPKSRMERPYKCPRASLRRGPEKERREREREGGRKSAPPWPRPLASAQKAGQHVGTPVHSLLPSGAG